MNTADAQDGRGRTDQPAACHTKWGTRSGDASIGRRMPVLQVVQGRQVCAQSGADDYHVPKLHSRETGASPQEKA